MEIVAQDVSRTIYLKQSVNAFYRFGGQSDALTSFAFPTARARSWYPLNWAKCRSGSVVRKTSARLLIDGSSNSLSKSSRLRRLRKRIESPDHHLATHF